MEILAHRGLWGGGAPPNSSRALRAALEGGFGIESDVRDYAGRLVISHDVADESCQDAEEAFRWIAEFGGRRCFAINVKADGLKGMLGELVARHGISSYFLFDMSVPQMVEFAEAGLRFFTRQSEAEPEPCLYERAAGVWIDGFRGTGWVTEGLLGGHLGNGKYVCVVSPELHGRGGYREFWGRLRGFRLDFSRVMLCTDHPEEAWEFFKRGDCDGED